MYMNAYHKEQGEVRMFEVDARNAIARFPDEWSAEPWHTDVLVSASTKPTRLEENDDCIDLPNRGADDSFQKQNK